MAEDERNHYQVLGLERTADARAIKSAYFGLVRQFSPETHPEAFKRIRTAYEVLSDAEARKRYDAAETDFREYGEGLGEALRLCEEALRAGDEPAAQSKLLSVLADRPDLVIAREKLGESYRRTDASALALEQFQELARLEPEEARHLFHQGLVLGRMDQHGDAEAVLRRALELKPDDVDIRVALADCLILQDQITQAIAEFDHALGTGSANEGQRLTLELRRIGAFFRAHDAARARQELDQFIGRILQEKDPDLHRYVAARLAALAAQEFAETRTVSGNELLERCQELRPGETPYHPYPAQVTLEVAELPESTQKMLLDQRPGTRSPVLAQSAWLRSLLTMAGCGLLVAACHWFLLGRPARWEAGDLLAAVLLFGGTITAVAFTLRSVLYILRSPLRAFITVQSLYLFQVRFRRVKVWSLFNLLNVEVVTHHTNGIYTRTSLRLRFPGESLKLTIRNRDFAIAWANHVGSRRQRVLELMMAGYLDAEPDIDLVPHELLRGTAPRAAGARSDIRQWFAGSAAATLVALGLALWVHPRVLDEVRWQAAVRDGSLGAYRAYLADTPSAGHAAQAEGQIGRHYDRAAAALAARTDPEAPGVRALSEALATLRHQASGRLALVVETGSELPAGVGTDTDEILRRGTESRRMMLTTGVQRALSATGLGGVIDLSTPGQVPGQAPDLPAELTLTIRETVRAEGEPLRAAGLPVLLPLGASWEVELMAAGAAQPFYRFSTTTTAPHKLRVARPAAGGERAWAQAIYAKLYEDSGQEFLTKLMTQWGLGRSVAPGPTALTNKEAPRLRRSPYEH